MKYKSFTGIKLQTINNSVHLDEFLRCLVSLPDRLFNKIGRTFSVQLGLLEKKPYFDRIVASIFRHTEKSCIDYLTNKESDEVIAPSYPAILSALCLRGQVAVVANYLIRFHYSTITACDLNQNESTSSKLDNKILIANKKLFCIFNNMSSQALDRLVDCLAARSFFSFFFYK
jgi:hypothetical protein